MDVDTDQASLSPADVDNLKVTELKKALRERKLEDKGLKSALQQRLKAFLTEEARDAKTTATPGPPEETTNGVDTEEVVDATVADADAETPGASVEDEAETPDEDEVFAGVVKTFKLNNRLLVTGEEGVFKRFGSKKEAVLVSLSDVLTDMSPVILTEGQDVEFRLRKDELGLYGTQLTLPGGEPVTNEGEQEAREDKFPREEYADGQVFTGKVVKFLQRQGTGFISIDADEEFTAPDTLKPQHKKRWEKTKELWFHRNDIVSTDSCIGLDADTEIEFTVYTDSRGMGAKEIKLKGGEPVSGFKQDLEFLRRKPKRDKKTKKRKRDEPEVDINPSATKKVRMVKRADGTMELVEDNAEKKKRSEWKSGVPNPNTGALRGRVIKYDPISRRGVVEADDTQYIILAWQIYKDKDAGVTDETVRLNANQRVEFFPGKTAEGEDLALYIMSKTGGPIKSKRNIRTRDRSPVHNAGRQNRQGRQAQGRQGRPQYARPQVQYVASMPQMQPMRMAQPMRMSGMTTMSGMQPVMAQMGGRQQLVYAVPQQQGSFTYVAPERRQGGRQGGGRQGGGRQGGGGNRNNGGRRRNRGGVY